MVATDAADVSCPATCRRSRTRISGEIGSDDDSASCAIALLRELGRSIFSRATSRISQASAWSPIFDVAQVLADEQSRVNGYITWKTHRSGVQMQTLGPPFSLRGTEPLLGPAPEAGQDTELVLSDLGLTWDEIASVRAG